MCKEKNPRERSPLTPRSLSFIIPACASGSNLKNLTEHAGHEPDERHGQRGVAAADPKMGGGSGVSGSERPPGVSPCLAPWDAVDRFYGWTGARYVLDSVFCIQNKTADHQVGITISGVLLCTYILSCSVQPTLPPGDEKKKNAADGGDNMGRPARRLRTEYSALYTCRPSQFPSTTTR